MDLPKATRDTLASAKRIVFSKEDARKVQYIAFQLTERAQPREDADIRMLTETLSQLVKGATRESL